MTRNICCHDNPTKGELDQIRDEELVKAEVDRMLVEFVDEWLENHEISDLLNIGIKGPEYRTEIRDIFMDMSEFNSVAAEEDAWSRIEDLRTDAHKRLRN